MPEDEKSDKKTVEPDIEPCVVFGTDTILSDRVDIDYYKACLEEFEASNRLLGEIMHNGDYVISQKVKQDLIKLPKELVAESDGTIEASTRINAKDLYFNIVIENDEELTASLYVTELVDGFGEVKSIKTFVASVKLDGEQQNAESVKAAFNVQKVVDGINEGEFIDLVIQIQDMIDYSAALSEIEMLSSQIYVLRLTQLLESGGSEAQNVLQNYYQQAKKLKIARNNYSDLRKLLDKIIDQAGGLKKLLPDKQKEIDDIKKEFAAPIHKMQSLKGKQIVKTASTQAPKKEEKKAAAKPADKKAAAKKTAGKSGGGSKPKKAKKKEDKKENKKDNKKKFGPGGPIKAAEPVPDLQPVVKNQTAITPVDPFKLSPRARKAVLHEVDELDEGFEMYVAIKGRIETTDNQMLNPDDELKKIDSIEAE